MIPRTLLSAESGGDGDPLDVIAFGSAIPRGHAVRTRIVGILELLDRGKQDDKLIAVSEDAWFAEVHDLEELLNPFPGIMEILKTWLMNYQGAGKMEFKRLRCHCIAEQPFVRQPKPPLLTKRECSELA